MVNIGTLQKRQNTVRSGLFCFSSAYKSSLIKWKLACLPGVRYWHFFWVEQLLWFYLFTIVPPLFYFYFAVYRTKDFTESLRKVQYNNFKYWHVTKVYNSAVTLLKPQFKNNPCLVHSVPSGIRRNTRKLTISSDLNTLQNFYTP